MDETETDALPIVAMPPSIWPSAATLSSDGVYLCASVQSMLISVGPSVSTSVLKDLFGVENAENLVQVWTTIDTLHHLLSNCSYSLLLARRWRLYRSWTQISTNVCEPLHSNSPTNSTAPIRSFWCLQRYVHVVLCSARALRLTAHPSL